MDPSTVATDIASPTNTPESRADQKPPTATRSLPGVAYTDPVLYEQELTEVFERAWILVGHVSELSEPGQYVTANVGREPVLVVRGHDGELRAMSNVCRHRASTILEGTGQTRSVMRCPYHAWTYELDGRLAAAPSGQGFACLDRDQVALPQFRVGVAGGLVFCCIDPGQMSLEEMLGPVGPYLEWLNIAGLTVHRNDLEARWTEDFDENWKILADNYLEDYHVPVAHPTLVRLVNVSKTIGDNNDWCEWSRVPYRTRPSRDPREREYQSLIRRMPGMPEEFEGCDGARLHLADDVHGDLPPPHRHLAARADRPVLDASHHHDAGAPRGGRPGEAGARADARAQRRHHGRGRRPSPRGCSAASRRRRTTRGS